MTIERQHLGVSAFVSLEWFHSGSKPPEQAESNESIYDWISKNTKNKKLNSDVQVKREESLTVRGKEASLFYRDNKPTDQVSQEFSKDFQDYKKIFTANRHDLVIFARAQNKLKSDLDHLAGPNATYDQVRTTILKQRDAGAYFGGDGAIAKSFKEPKEKFLGDYETKFLTDGGKEFNTVQEVKNHDVVGIPCMPEEKKDQVVKLAFDIQAFMFELDDLKEEIGVCVDMTDSPIRGFIEEIDKDAEVMDAIRPFTEYGMQETDRNAGLLDVLHKRVSNLHDAIWKYIKQSCN